MDGGLHSKRNARLKLNGGGIAVPPVAAYILTGHLVTLSPCHLGWPDPDHLVTVSCHAAISSLIHTFRA